jgi:hypothetical protein
MQHLTTDRRKVEGDSKQKVYRTEEQQILCFLEDRGR